MICLKRLSQIQRSTVSGFIGMLIGGLCFTIHFYYSDVTIPFYSILCAPAIFALSFFSEETPFVPKMILFQMGQFFGYFLMYFVSAKMRKILSR